MAKKIGFTLAGVLITLTIFGVVAALTIPTLWAKIGTIVNSNRKEVIEDRLLEGLNQLNSSYRNINSEDKQLEHDFRLLCLFCINKNLLKIMPEI